MKLRTLGLTILFGALFATPAYAQDIELGHPTYGGTGCPQGSVGTGLSPDNTQLSVLFDEYVVEAGGVSGRRIARKNCNLSIPVIVPQGYSIAIFKVDYRGYTFVPWGAQARFTANYHYGNHNGRGLRLTKTFRGEVDDDYYIADAVVARNLVWSPCGAKTNLRINTSMMARSNRFMDDTLATLDSVDVESGLIYHIKWRRCGGF